MAPTGSGTAATAGPQAGREGRRGVWIAVALVIAGFALLGPYAFGEPSGSGDLLGLWIAGDAFRAGPPALLYPPDATLFRMLPPPGWESLAAPYGADFAVFPFIYPPLWAWVSGWLGTVTSFAAFQAAMSWINPVLIALMVLAAWRVAAPGMHPVTYLVTGLAVLSISTVGTIAILSNHLQILVAFLCVLAIERAEAGRPRTAGALLALAAAIKLYPALYAVFWLAGGQRRAFAAFALAGAALAGLSVAVAGWPLHAEFLRILSVLGRTAVLTVINYAAETALGQVLFRDAIQHVTPDWGPAAGWHVMAKPGWFAAALQGASLLAVAGFALAFARARAAAADRRVLLWPAAMIVLSLLGPIGWSYYYLAPLAFAPALLARLGAPAGGLVLAAFAGFTSPAFLIAGPDLPGVLAPFALFGTIALLGLAAAFLVARRGRPQ